MMYSEKETSEIVSCVLDNNDNLALTEENKRQEVSTLSPPEACFLCREKDSPDADCKVCHNISTYRSKNEKCANGLNGDDNADICFPGPGIVKRNHIYGNYVVASRTIEAGELIILEKPLTIGPYSPPDMLPLCLSCCKDIGRSFNCSVCRWPVCGEDCEKFYLHAENECKIFAKCGVKSKGVMNEYFSVEVLRTLLLREKNASAWHRVLQFESHVDARSNDYRAKLCTDFIIHFIRDKCKLADEFSPEVIDHVVGVLSVNTFWAFKELNRYASCLFDKSTLLAHDCNPNTTRKMVFLKETDSYDDHTNSNGFQNDVTSIALHITASRRIVPGEMITIRYIDLDQSLSERRQELKETFYFDCTCSRCLEEMAETETHQNQCLIEKKLMETTIN